MDTNMQVQKEVVRAVEAEIGNAESRIGISVEDGAVMLGGTAATYCDKYAAERAARQVSAVRAVSEGIHVGTDSAEPMDNSIARAIAHALQRAANVPANIQATVERGWITLRGEVTTTAQREAAFKTVKNAAGVERIYNLITIKPAE